VLAVIGYLNAAGADEGTIGLETTIDAIADDIASALADDDEDSAGDLL
jgi:hypothetical protein